MKDHFLAMINDAKHSGGRVFEEWLSNPDKFLGKRDFSIDNILLALGDEDRKKIAPILEYFTSLSFFYLFKRLEEGEGDYSFSLTMRNDADNEEFRVIGDVDLDIRSEMLAPD